MCKNNQSRNCLNSEECLSTKQKTQNLCHHVWEDYTDKVYEVYAYELWPNRVQEKKRLSEALLTQKTAGFPYLLLARTCDSGSRNSVYLLPLHKHETNRHHLIEDGGDFIWEIYFTLMAILINCSGGKFAFSLYI